MRSATETEVINTTEQIANLVDRLVSHHVPPVSYSPAMYIDLEGANLCRDGSIAIFALLVDTGVPTKQAYLIDIHTLQSLAFNTAGIEKKTMKEILEDEQIPKVFFDVRNDSDALFVHFGIALKGVEDVQLMESATRKTTISRRLLSGLSKCIEKHVVFGDDKASLKLAKEKGEQLFRPECGGSYEVFTQRPIPKDIISYCIGDVQYLPDLRDRFWKPQNSRWRNLVKEVTQLRVAGSQAPDYQPHGRHKALAPWNASQNSNLNQWN